MIEELKKQIQELPVEFQREALIELIDKMEEKLLVETSKNKVSQENAVQFQEALKKIRTTDEQVALISKSLTESRNQERELVLESILNAAQMIKKGSTGDTGSQGEPGRDGVDGKDAEITEEFMIQVVAKATEQAVEEVKKVVKIGEDVTLSEDQLEKLRKQLLKDVVISINSNAFGGSSSASIATLTDVELDSLANGQILVYNSTTEKWENTDLAGGGDMLKATYDPTNVSGDAFNMANMAEAADAKVLTSAERDAIAANTFKVTYPTSASDKLATIEESAEVNNISDPNAATLTDGSNADSLHGHTAAAITDFDTEVSNNDDVAANSAKITYPLSASDKLATIEESADVTDSVNIGTSINGATGKTTPVNADSFGIIDSEASNLLKNLTFTNLKAFLKTYFDTLYSGGGGATKALFHETDFSSITQNFVSSASGTSSSVAYSSNDLRMYTGTSYPSVTKLRPTAWSQQAGQVTNIFDRNPVVSFIGKKDAGTPGSTGMDYGLMIGSDNYAGTGSGVAASTKGFGFIHHDDSGGDTFTFFCANGSNVTQSADLSSHVTDDKYYDIVMDVTSGTDIKCYINGTLRATLSDYLPTGAYAAYPWQFAGFNASSDFSINTEYFPKHLSIMLDPAD